MAQLIITREEECGYGQIGTGMISLNKSISYLYMIRRYQYLFTTIINVLPSKVMQVPESCGETIERNELNDNEQQNIIDRSQANE